jgi:hypothetical protein
MEDTQRSNRHLLALDTSPPTDTGLQLLVLDTDEIDDTQRSNRHLLPRRGERKLILLLSV